MSRHTGRSTRDRGRRPRYPRKGLETVELALTLPFIVLFGLGVIEFSRALTVQQVLTNAAREGARQAILPDSSVEAVKEKVAENLRIGSIDPTAGVVGVTPSSLSGSKSGTAVTVNVQVPYHKVSWLPVPQYLGNAVLGSQCSMRHE